ncbi:HAD-IA family hydrolase [Streptomyces sp. T-3]|nr:HAD-IA family hydrolase [Streptomyces sp. T-3]
MTEAFTALVAGAENVLFDFDGPVCRLFARRPAIGVSAHLVRWLDDHDQGALLGAGERGQADPMALLQTVDERDTDGTVMPAFEAELAAEELRATDTAYPTPYVDVLIQTWSALGVRLAIASNNSEAAVRRYLESRSLSRCFDDRIHGRSHELHRLKPHPDCVYRALDSLGAEASTALMIGDTPADFEAARKAGVSFLGYGSDEQREQRLRAAGAEHVVGSLEPVLDLVRRGAGPHS